MGFSVSAPLLSGPDRLDQARRACELAARGWPWPAAVKLSRLGPLDSGPIEPCRSLRYLPGCAYAALQKLAGAVKRDDAPESRGAGKKGQVNEGG